MMAEFPDGSTEMAVGAVPGFTKVVTELVAASMATICLLVESDCDNTKQKSGNASRQ